MTHFGIWVVLRRRLPATSLSDFQYHGPYCPSQQSVWVPTPWGLVRQAGIYRTYTYLMPRSIPELPRGCIRAVGIHKAVGSWILYSVPTSLRILYSVPKQVRISGADSRCTVHKHQGASRGVAPARPLAALLASSSMTWDVVGVSGVHAVATPWTENGHPHNRCVCSEET